MSGTGIVTATSGLQTCYAKSGTDIAIASSCYSESGRPASTEGSAAGGGDGFRGIGLRACYAMFGTDIAYGLEYQAEMLRFVQNKVHTPLAAYAPPTRKTSTDSRYAATSSMLWDVPPQHCG
eukprot:969589-Rhodomonas_salina.2